MIEPQSYSLLKQEIAESIVSNRAILDQLRSEIRPLKSEVRRILPRNTTPISLVATDGGNNTLHFDPFLVHIIRVVDSSNNEYCLEAVTPATSIARLSAKQFDADGQPRTSLGELMEYLGVRHLDELSYMMRKGNPKWIEAYRELVEWAILFAIVREKDFGTDTLIVYDGLLRSVIFKANLFKKYLEGIQESIETQQQKNHRKLYIVGVAKQSKVLARYRLAMALEGILTTNYAAYTPVPNEIEQNAYSGTGYALSDDNFVGSKMFFVKFGSAPRDSIWPIDIFLPQKEEAAHILGCLLADSVNGFPVPFYPLCLQKAHENAALVDFDFSVLQDHIFYGIRQILAEEASVLDAFRLQDTNPADIRYGYE